MGIFLDSRTLRCGSGPISSESPRAKQIGRFELKREIARGGMGIVFEAYDSDLKQAVALKVLHPWSAHEDEARFRHEARVIARLRHPNIVRVYALGRDSGRWYLVLDYVDGESLRERLERTGPLPGPEAAALLEPIARAVHYAHCRGVIHRDLKPANVLLPRIGAPMLVDFGLAKELAATSAQPITQNGAVLGTPPYMAPEQVLGGSELDSRTDIYGLGATLYRMLSGRHPFDGKMLEVLDAVLKHDPPALSSLVEVDPRLEAICKRCMAKDPAKRYRTAEEVAEALADYVARPEPQVSWISSTFSWPTQATFFYGRKPRFVPNGVRFVRRNALLPAAAILFAACAILPLGGLLAAREGDPDRDPQIAGAASERPRGASRRLLPDRARLARIRAGEPSVAVDGEDERGDSPRDVGPLRTSGQRTSTPPPTGQAERGVESPRPASEVAVEDAGLTLLHVASSDLAPRAAVAAGGAGGVLFALSREPLASSVAPEVSSRRARSRSDSAQGGLGNPVGIPDGQVAPDPTDPIPSFEPGAPDAVSQALTAYEQAPLAAGQSVNFEELLTLDGRAPAYRAVPLQQSVGSAQSALLQPFGGVVFSAHGRKVDWLLPNQVHVEVELPFDVSSVAVGGGGAFVGTTGPAGSEGGNVYRRTPDGRWELSFDGTGDYVLTTQLAGDVFAFSWAPGETASVYKLAVPAYVDPASDSWVKVADLGVERPSLAVSYRGALWVACSPTIPDTEIAFYVGAGRGWARVEVEDAGDAKTRQIARATALLEHGGNLFMTVAYTDADTNIDDGGDLFACDLNEEKLEFDQLANSLHDSDVPLSLAHNENTLYVGTLSGRLLYLIPDPDRDLPEDFDPMFEEDVVPGSLGIHSLLPRNDGALMLGQFGPAATDVVLRVREQ